MAELIIGLREFSDKIVPAKQALFDQLATGQSPATRFVTCADSRIDPSLITPTDPGGIFVVRNAGNIVPRGEDSGSSSNGNTAASSLDALIEGNVLLQIESSRWS